MSDDQDHDEGARPRPRVVDKRVSARSAEGVQRESPEPSPAPEPPVAGDEGGAPETFRPPPEENSPTPPSGELWTPEMEAEAQRVADEIARVPARDWVVSAAMNLANVGGVKLQGGDFPGAQLAIDGLAALIQASGPRLGDAETPLRQLLAQLQFAYAEEVAAPPAPAGG